MTAGVGQTEEQIHIDVEWGMTWERNQYRRRNLYWRQPGRFSWKKDLRRLP